MEAVIREGLKVSPGSGRRLSGADFLGLARECRCECCLEVVHVGGKVVEAAV